MVDSVLKTAQHDTVALTAFARDVAAGNVRCAVASHTRHLAAVPAIEPFVHRCYCLGRAAPFDHRRQLVVAHKPTVAQLVGFATMIVLPCAAFEASRPSAAAADCERLFSQAKFHKFVHKFNFKTNFHLKNLQLRIA